MHYSQPYPINAEAGLSLSSLEVAGNDHEQHKPRDEWRQQQKMVK